MGARVKRRSFVYVCTTLQKAVTKLNIYAHERGENLIIRSQSILTIFRYAGVAWQRLATNGEGDRRNCKSQNRNAEERSSGARGRSSRGDEDSCADRSPRGAGSRARLYSRAKRKPCSEGR